MTDRRLSICYVVPGHDLMASMGPTRNVLSVAQALSQWADVAVAFRRLADARAPNDLRLLEIQPGAHAATVDDAAMRGMGYGEFLSYLRALRRFVKTELREFDVILEKSWLISGYLSSLCRRRGQIGVPVENIVPNPVHAARGQLPKLLRLYVGRWLARRQLRRAPLIITETQYTRNALAEWLHVPRERITAVDLGVDRNLFRPMEQAEVRRRLGIASGKTILVYVGVLDATHNLEPAISAMVRRRDPSVALHVVGDGARRGEYERIAAPAGDAVVFHGRVPHTAVPAYIAAGDLCLAPYESAAFTTGELGYSTMKIPEYMSAGRAVASVPSGRIPELVRDSETGFLFANDLDNWRRFLADLPTRERLRELGAAAAGMPLTSWEDTARAYLSLCEDQVRARARFGK